MFKTPLSSASTNFSPSTKLLSRQHRVNGKRPTRGVSPHRAVRAPGRGALGARSDRARERRGRQRPGESVEAHRDDVDLDQQVVAVVAKNVLDIGAGLLKWGALLGGGLAVGGLFGLDRFAYSARINAGRARVWASPSESRAPSTPTLAASSIRMRSWADQQRGEQRIAPGPALRARRESEPGHRTRRDRHTESRLHTRPGDTDEFIGPVGFEPPSRSTRHIGARFKSAQGHGPQRINKTLSRYGPTCALSGSPIRPEKLGRISSIKWAVRARKSRTSLLRSWCP